MNDYVVVLGSGKSINDLSITEREFIDNCKVKIGINKYGMFYNKAEIKPTHIYFMNDYDNGTINFFVFMLKKLSKDKIKGLTLIISDRYKSCLNSNPVIHYFHYIKNFILKILQKILILVGYILFSKINYNSYRKYKYIIKSVFPFKRSFRYTLIDRSWNQEYLTIDSIKDSKAKWAISIKEPMYHYRGSLTTVLNYISIKFPNMKILFVGVDLNTSSYFFEEELSRLPIKTDDWTTKISQSNNKHFSIIEHEGTKMDDVFGDVIGYLKQSGNKVFSMNKESYLVLNGFIDYIDV